MNVEKTNILQPITVQSLGSLIKSARDIMRKDKGLNGDLDRLPMLTWIMFLKFLDDLELQRDEEATLAGKKFQRAIDPPYRWRDWAAKPGGITGDELISFVNNEEAVLPDGSRGPGLFAYLRSLTGRNGGDRRDVIATVFKGTINRMINGYLLRDVINKIAGIHFGSSEELHTLGSLYESMLREMRDAAGDSGEFYTPRPVVRFMVAVTDPKLGETILDPACGTGGFLVEAFEHLEKQCKTVQDRELVQKRSIFGGEAKPLPYLLAQMNLLLHGLESPQISPNNSLAVRIAEIGEKDRVGIILTNPPFGGEEERGILANFPSDKQTSETILLFLQLIMRKIKRTPNPGRAAVVVPNGVFSAPGVAKRIRANLLEEFNLHTIVRLPHNVFAPYTDVKTNILFFDRTSPTREIFYCEPQLPPKLTLSKTKPLPFEWLEPLRDIIKRRTTSDYSWIVDTSKLDESLNLDIKNPCVALGELRQTDRPDHLAIRLRQIATASDEIQARLSEVLAQVTSAPLRLLGELTEESDERVGDDYRASMKLIGVSAAQGLTQPKTKIGKHPESYKILRPGYLAYNPMRVNIGSIGVMREHDEEGITSPDYVVFYCRDGVLPDFIYHFLRSEPGLHAINQKTKGSVRFRLYYDRLSEIRIPMPDDTLVQSRFVEVCNRLERVRQELTECESITRACLTATTREAFLITSS